MIGVFLERGNLDTDEDMKKDDEVKTQEEDIHPKLRTGTKPSLSVSRR